MSSNNPTRLRLGMSGTVRGKRYRIVGRVVMSMEQESATYYWNEFHLVTAENDEATLVFEQTENGPQWRLFIMFEPQFPIPAEDAATKAVGDSLNLDGTDMRVTLVDESRVSYIEGEPPEGVERGDVAHYFNAEAPGRMVVVSWTGDEVECFRGTDLSSGAVKAAFGLTEEPVSGFSSLLNRPGAAGRGSLVPRLVVLLVILGAAVFGLRSCWRGSKRESVVFVGAPVVKPPISVGRSLVLQGITYRVVEQSLGDVVTVGWHYQWQEFQLDGGEIRARLIFGLNPKKSDWFLFTGVEPPVRITGEKAAAFRAGETINLGLGAATITDLFQETVQTPKVEESPDSPKTTRWFGFRAKSNATDFLVEWNETGVAYYAGTALSDKQVANALTAPAAK